MKKIIMAGVMLAFALPTNAQMTLQHSYTDADYFKVVDLLISGKKYCITDFTANQVRLYNLNNTLWKTINLPTVSGYTSYTGYDVAYVSENLFKLDNKVDLVVTYINSTNTVYKVIVIDEAGAIINNIDSAQSLYVYNIGIDSFVASTNMYTSTNYKLYTLPGTIPCNTCSGNSLGLGKPIGNGTAISMSDAIPNPASNEISVRYSVPNNISGAVIVITDQTGKEIGKYNLSTNDNHIDINTSALSSGVYIYRLIAGDNTLVKKFIIAH